MKRKCLCTMDAIASVRGSLLGPHHQSHTPVSMPWGVQATRSGLSESGYLYQNSTAHTYSSGLAQLPDSARPGGSLTEPLAPGLRISLPFLTFWTECCLILCARLGPQL